MLHLLLAVIEQEKAKILVPNHISLIYQEITKRFVYI